MHSRPLQPQTAVSTDNKAVTQHIAAPAKLHEASSKRAARLSGLRTESTVDIAFLANRKKNFAACFKLCIRRGSRLHTWSVAMRVPHVGSERQRPTLGCVQ